MSLTRSYERHTQVIVELAAATPAPKPAPLQRYGATATIAPKTTTGLAFGPYATMTDTTRKTRWIRQLTPAQMAERKRSGLCYNCDEKYHRNHNCKQLYIIELAQDNSKDDEEPIDVDSKISLHALTGINIG